METLTVEISLDDGYYIEFCYGDIVEEGNDCKYWASGWTKP